MMVSVTPPRGKNLDCGLSPVVRDTLCPHKLASTNTVHLGGTGLLACPSAGGQASWPVLLRVTIVRSHFIPHWVLFNSVPVEEFRTGWVVEEFILAIGLAVQDAVAAPVPYHRR